MNGIISNLKSLNKYFRIRFFHLKKIIFYGVINFNKFWNNFDKKSLPIEMITIIDKFLLSDSKNFVSGWWKYNNIKDIKALSVKGIENYGEIFFHYYTWYDWSNKEIEGLLKELVDTKINIHGNIYKRHRGLSYNQSFKLNILLLSLYMLLKTKDEFVDLNKLKDDSFCNNSHPFIEIENKKITHDKINSLLEVSEIKKLSLLDDNYNILEIGAGSGRLADTILSIQNNCKYIICDIPCALYISYFRLNRHFQDKKVFLAIDLNDKTALNLALEDNDIIFIFPHQLKYIKKKFFDLTLSISALHEMESNIIKFYMDNINRVSKSLYFTVWEETLIPFSLKGTKLHANNQSYFIKEDWKEISNKSNFFPNNIIQRAFLIN